MRALLCSWLLLCLLCAAPSRAAEIDEVLDRSQQQRLRELPLAPPDDEQVAIVRISFERLCVAMQVNGPVELRVITGPVIAEALLGRVVVANRSLGALPEGERLFVLAHELGHVARGHWARVGKLFRSHIPGPVVPAETDRVAGALGAEMSALMYSQELDADAFALIALNRLGYGFDAAMAVFLRQGVTQDTATHPSTRKRVAHLRTLQ